VELKLPNPFARFDSSAQYTGEGWQETETLSHVYAASYPWIWVTAQQQW
jgi:hypothetical protein